MSEEGDSDLSDRLARLEERVPREIDSLPEFAKLVQRMFAEVAERLERLQGDGMSARFEVDLDRLEELAELFL